MKLSEAILEGAQKVRQGYGFYISHDRSECCALGMVKLACGILCITNGRVYSNYSEHLDTLPKNIVNTLRLKDSKSQRSFDKAIVYWNDELKLPPHEIAMRVASIECKAERGEEINLDAWG